MLPSGGVDDKEKKTSPARDLEESRAQTLHFDVAFTRSLEVRGGSMPARHSMNPVGSAGARTTAAHTADVVCLLLLPIGSGLRFKGGLGIRAPEALQHRQASDGEQMTISHLNCTAFGFRTARRGFSCRKNGWQDGMCTKGDLCGVQVQQSLFSLFPHQQRRIERNRTLTAQASRHSRITAA
jgi:hypothetical protein